MTILFIHHTNGLSWIKNHVNHKDLSPGARHIRWLAVLSAQTALITVRFGPVANNALQALCLK